MLATLVLLTSLTEFMAQQVTERLGEGVDREPQQEQETYQGHSIHFTHQYWRIQPDSVCADRQAKPDYEVCRQQAMALFANHCQRLSSGSAEEQESPRRAMYCAAAEPVAATVSASETSDVSRTPSKPEIELQRGRRECNRLRFKAMLSDDPALRQERDQVCAQQSQ